MPDEKIFTINQLDFSESFSRHKYGVLIYKDGLMIISRNDKINSLLLNSPDWLDLTEDMGKEMKVFISQDLMNETTPHGLAAISSEVDNYLSN